MVAMLAAAVRMLGSPMLEAAPRYAPTPTCSTTRATGSMVETLSSTWPKSKVQLSGVTPNDSRTDWKNATERSEREKER